MSSPPRPTNERQHILTVNVEDYFQVGAFKGLIQPNQWDRFDTRLITNLEASLAFLRETNNQATFFTSGWIAKKYPDLIRLVIEEGHEIACQGYHQQSINDLQPDAFAEDLRHSKQTTEDIIGARINGFRIGRGWIGPNNLWALDTLLEYGFTYDSSFCPLGRQFNDEEFRMRLHKHQSDAGHIWEVPISATKWLGWSIPFSGGNYVRQFPRWATREAAARWVEKRASPLVMYFHIWEIDAEQPNISAANWLQRTRHYRNLERMRERMHYFLTRYPFTSVQNYLGLVQYSIDEKDQIARNFLEDFSSPIARSKDTTFDLTVIVPCYNEEASLNYLSQTLLKLKEQTRNLFDLKFLFVNDGSTDATGDLLQQYFGQRSDSKIVCHQENNGIGQAIITGFEQAHSEFVAVIDADCTFDPLQLPEMIQLMGPETAAIAASPLHQGGRVDNVPQWRLWFSRGAAFLYRRVLTHKFSGYTGCFRIYRMSAIEDINVYNPGFCGVTEILARLDLGGYELLECPAELQTRLLGQSKINLLRTTLDHIKLILRIAAARWLNQPLPTPDRIVAIDAE